MKYPFFVLLAGCNVAVFLLAWIHESYGWAAFGALVSGLCCGAVPFMWLCDRWHDLCREWREDFEKLLKKTK